MRPVFFTYVLLAISLLANLYFYTDLRRVERQLTAAQEDKQLFLTQYDILKRDQDRLQENVIALRKADVQHLPLRPTAQHPEASAVIHWNPTTGQLYIDANGLPAPPGQKQYQGWIIKQGKYESAGVFNYQPDRDNLFLLNNTTAADGFAVSLEKIQGNLQPTDLWASTP